jgi:hypothetical protein
MKPLWVDQSKPAMGLAALLYISLPNFPNAIFMAIALFDCYW